MNHFNYSRKSQWTYNASNQIRFKISVLRSNLFDYSDAYIHVSGTIAITKAGTDDDTKRADEKNKGVIFKIERHLMTA